MKTDGFVRGVLDSEPGSDRFAACPALLANAALAKDRVLVEEASRMMCERIVEPWSDSFEPALVQAHVWFMSEVVVARRWLQS